MVRGGADVILLGKASVTNVLRSSQRNVLEWRAGPGGRADVLAFARYSAVIRHRWKRRLPQPGLYSPLSCLTFCST